MRSTARASRVDERLSAANTEAMITARRSLWFERLFHLYNRNLIARRFEGLRVAGMHNVRGAEADMPLMLYANHSSWWDGLVAFEIGVNCKFEQFVMMEERQLRRYPLFRLLGAFSVERERWREARGSIEYAAGLLRGDAGGSGKSIRALWIFPQGLMLPNDARPLDFYTGAAHIANRLERVALLPVAMRYEHLGDFRPEILVRIGAPACVEPKREVGTKRFTQSMEAALTETLDRVRADLLAEDLSEYEELVAPYRRSKHSDTASKFLKSQRKEKWSK